MSKLISGVLGTFNNAGFSMRNLVPSTSSTRTPRTVHPPSAVNRNIIGGASASASADLPPTNWTPMSQPSPTNEATVRIVIKRNRVFNLIYVNITDRSPIQAVIQEVRLAAEIFVGRTYVLKLFHNVFYHQHISIAAAPIAYNVDSQVTIDVNTPRRPVGNPHLADDVESATTSFTERYPMVIESDSDGDSDGTMSYLLVETKLKKHVVLMCSFAAIVGSIVAGVVVGLISRNAAYGIAATAGIVGILALLAQLLTWAVAV